MTFICNQQNYTCFMKHSFQINQTRFPLSNFVLCVVLLFFSCLSSNKDQSVLSYLISEGADVGANTADGRTPLHLAAGKGKLGVVQALVKQEVSVLDKSDDGQETSGRQLKDN